MSHKVHSPPRYPFASIHQLIENQALLNPQATALSWKNETLSYETLNEKANQVAHYLKAATLKQETLVVVVLERSLELMITLLGILKAGGAYVPIDPDYPPERMRFMLRDSKSPVLITQKKIRRKIHSFRSLPNH